jgi:hypothetical protein
VRVQNGPPVPKLAQIGTQLGRRLAWVRREQKAAAKAARFGAHFTQIITFSVFTIRVKGPPKPDPVKHRPPLLFPGIRHASYTYIHVTSPFLPNVANAPPVAGYRRHPPRRFVSSPSPAPTAPLGPAFPASPRCHRLHLALDELQRLAHTL